MENLPLQKQRGRQQTQGEQRPSHRYAQQGQRAYQVHHEREEADCGFNRFMWSAPPPGIPDPMMRTHAANAVFSRMNTEPETLELTISEEEEAQFYQTNGLWPIKIQALQRTAEAATE